MTSWRIRNHPNRPVEIYEPVEGYCIHIATMSGSAANPDVMDDANLIAAAPELLEALKGVVRVADRNTVEFDAARAAIAKAEGK